MGRHSAGLLLERESQLAVAAGLLTRARRGTGGVLVLEGPAGIGKTSLLAAIAARAKGFRVCRARPGDLERTFAFGVVRSLFARAITDAPYAFAGPGAAARRVLEPGEAIAESSSLLFGLFWAAATIAAREPVLLLVDDAQWADDPSLDWLRFLADHAAEAAIAVVLATRDDAHPAPLGRLMAAGGPVTVSRVPPLGTSAVRMLVEHGAGGDVDPRLAETAMAATGGNPFLLGELLRGWRESGTVSTLAVTAQLRRQIEDRVAAAHPDAGRLAAAIAVLGGTNVRLIDAASLASLPREAARAAAEALRRADVLADESDLGFSHPLVREAIYLSLGPLRRAQAHATAAELLHGRGDTDEAVATHLLLAEPAASAASVATLRRAARVAMQRGAPENASQLLVRALAEPPPRDERSEVLEELGQAQSRANHTDAEPTLRAALEQAPDDHAPRIALELGRLLVRQGRGRAAEQLLHEHLPCAERTDRDLALSVEAEIHAASRAEPGVAPRPPSRAAVERPELRGDTPGERLLLASLCFEAAIAGAPRALQERLGRRALGDGDLIADQGPDAQIVYFVIVSLSHLAPGGALLGELDRALEVAQRLGSVSGYTIARAWRAEQQLRAGALDEAQADALDALALATEHGVAIAIPLAVFPLVLARIESGAPGQAEADLAAYGFDGEIPAAGLFSAVRYARGRVHLARGNADAACRDFLAAGRMLLDAGVITPTIVPWRSDAGVLCAAAGDGDRGRALVGEELALARRVGAARTLGLALRAHALLGPPEERRGGLRAAADELRTAADPVSQARTLIELGLAQLRGGEREIARDTLREALDLADRRHATALADRAQEELIVAGARPRRRRRTGRDALTAAELRVARLAAAGRTNREIAAELFLTPKTVETHLGHVYAKLGVRGRRELGDALAAATDG